MPDQTTIEAHRLALSEALGLGTGAPWDAIRDRAAELNAELETARKVEQSDTERLTHLEGENAHLRLAAYEASRTQTVDQAALREIAVQAIRDAACAGDCGQTEEECAKERIQPFAWHHGTLAVVEGSPEQFADAVLAVLPAITNHDTDTSAALREASDRLWALANRTTERGQGVLWAADWLRRVADETAATETCGRTTSVAKSEYPPCARPAGHSEAYCRSADRKTHFLALYGPRPAAGARQDGAQQ